MFTYYFNELKVFEQNKDILESIFKRMLQELKEVSIERVEVCHNIIDYLQKLFEFSYISQYFFSSSNQFNQFSNGYYLQNYTIFGQILSCSIFSDENIYYNEHFANINAQNIDQLQLKANQIGQKLTSVVLKFTDFINGILQKDNRYIINRFQLWCQKVVELNVGKLKTFQAYEMTSKNGFLCNFLKFMMLLNKQHFNSFVSIRATIVNEGIDELHNMYGFYNSETTLASSENTIELDPLYQNLDDLYDRQQFQVIKQEKLRQSCFYDTMAALKTILSVIYLIVPMLKKYNKLCENIIQNQQQGKCNSPLYRELIIQKLSYDAILGDEIYGSLLLKFLTYQCEVCLFLNHIDFRSDRLKIELKPSFNYSQLPSVIVENIPENIMFLHYTHQKCMNKYKEYTELILSFMIILLKNRMWLSNPHLRLQIMEVIFVFSSKKCNLIENTQDQYFFIQKFYENNKICKENFFQALIQCYLEYDKMQQDEGSNINKETDKYTYSFKLSQILSFLAQFKSFQQQIFKFVDQNRKQFLLFVIAYLNTHNQVFQEYQQINIKYDQLKEIMNISSVNMNVSFTKRNQFENLKKILIQYENLVTSLIENFKELVYFTKDIFLQDEIVEKTVNSVNQSIKYLGSLKFEQDVSTTFIEQNQNTKKKYNPHSLLTALIDIFLNLSQYEIFLNYLVKDQFVFDIEQFESLMYRLVTRQDKIEKLIELVQTLREKTQKHLQLEEIAMEAPSDFLDPIINEIMIDPVKLPSSQNILSRLTIKKHLLIDSSDPYTRDRLLEDMLIPQPLLQQKINEYLRLQIKNRLVKQDVSKIYK